MDVEGARLLGCRQQYGPLVNDRNSTPGPYVQPQSPEQLHVEMYTSHPTSMRSLEVPGLVRGSGCVCSIQPKTVRLFPISWMSEGRAGASHILRALKIMRQCIMWFRERNRSTGPHTQLVAMPAASLVLQVVQGEDTTWSHCNRSSFTEVEVNCSLSD